MTLDAPPTGGERALLAVLAGAALAYSLMQSLVIPALPAIQRSLHASPDATSWTVTGFLLSSAVATPIAGRLGDMFGKRRVLVALLAIVSLGTLLCVVPSMPALIIGRVVQGVSGGVLPLGYAIVRDELRPARVAHGIALLASLLGVGGGLGVIIAGVLVEHLSYTWMFWLQLPAFLAVAYFVHRYVPDSKVTAPARVDWAGAVLVSSALLALLFTITQASRWGIGSARTLLGFAIAFALFAVWARSALRRADPLLDLRLMRRRPVWTTNVVAFLVGVGQFAGFILLPQYVQEPASTGYGFGASPLASGVFLLPMTVAIALVGLIVGRLDRRFGAKPLLIAGNVVAGGSFLLLTFARAKPIEVYVASGLLGIGVGLAMAALATLIVSNVAQHETGVAAGVNNVARTLGGAVGGQLAAALLAASTSAAGLPRDTGFTPAFAVGLAALVLATAIGPLLPGRLEDPTATPARRLRGETGLAYRR
jgi:EmrB/QacA subfamily drug resistance transporter